MNHYPHHIGDYIKSTVHLSNAEDLTYRRLIEHYYDTERPISKETQSVAKRLRVKTQSVIRILSEFFVERDDGWHNIRCDEEIARFKGFVEYGRAGAEKRWGSKANDSPPIAPLKPPLSGANSNQNQNQNHIKPKPAASAADSVKKEIWEKGKAILNGDGKDPSGFIGKLCKEYGQILVLEAIRDCEKSVPAEPKAWLVARCQERRQKGNGNGKFNPVQYVNEQLAKGMGKGAPQEVFDDLHGEVHALLPRPRDD